MQAYTEIMEELERRDTDRDGALAATARSRSPRRRRPSTNARAIDALVQEGK